jgi:hypothetical protein
MNATERWAAIAGAIAIGTFWVLAAILGTFVGAEIVRHRLWFPSQLLHTLGALLVMVALPGLCGQVSGKRYYATIPLMAAMAGTALFAADGLIALSVFPTLANVAPQLLDLSGAMNRGTMLTTYIVVSATNMLGWVALAASLWRSGTPSVRRPLICVGVGAVLFNLPPGPVPLALLALGGLLWSIGLVALSRLRPGGY